MRSRLNVLLLIIVLAMLTPGCIGSGQQDTASIPVSNGSAGVANASRQSYVDEFHQGFEHNTAASRLFNNATARWNEDDYAGASSLLTDADREYILATGHYHNMAMYASNDAEMSFAKNLEGSAIDMHEATSRYIMSIKATTAGNDTAASTYFDEGQALADQAMAYLNSSVQAMPPGLG